MRFLPGARAGIALLAAATAAPALIPAQASASLHPSPVVGHVYVDDNTPH